MPPHDLTGGGDELEDDFEIEPEFMPEAEEEEQQQELSKTERLKQARKNDKAWWVLLLWVGFADKASMPGYLVWRGSLFSLEAGQQQECSLASACACCGSWHAGPQPISNEVRRAGP